MQHATAMLTVVLDAGTLELPYGQGLPLMRRRGCQCMISRMVRCPP